MQYLIFPVNKAINFDIIDDAIKEIEDNRILAG